MTRLSVCLLTIGIAACAVRQDGPTPAPPPAHVSAATPAVTEASIRAHMSFLASDALNGRGSGTRDEWITAEYLASAMLRLGLDPMGGEAGFVQEIEVQRFETQAPPVLVAGTHELTHGREILVRAVVGTQVSGALRRFSEGGQVQPGTAVILEGPVPQGATVAIGRAAIVLQRETPAFRDRWAAMGGSLPPVAGQVVGVPAGAARGPTWVTLDEVSHAAVLALPEGAEVSVRADVQPAARTKTWNAVGRLTGADPAGASDVLVLSFFGSEEAGGYGSRYFVDRPVVPLTDIAANLQFEMMGRPDPLVPPGTLWLTGYERSTLGVSLASQGARLVADPRPDQRFFERSDNIQFARRGVVAHTVSSFGLHREYHQPSDEMRHINVAHMRDAIASLIEPVRWLANATGRPSWHAGMEP